jgi:hypothetical protein
MIAGFSDGGDNCASATFGAGTTMQATASGMERARKHFIFHPPGMVTAGDYSLDDCVKIRTIT